MQTLPSVHEEFVEVELDGIYPSTAGVQTDRLLKRMPIVNPEIPVRISRFYSASGGCYSRIQSCSVCTNKLS